MMCNYLTIIRQITLNQAIEWFIFENKSIKQLVL